MNYPNLKLATQNLETLCTQITELKREESILAGKRASLEIDVINLVGAKEEGANTTTLADGRKLTVTGKLIYSADMQKLMVLAESLPLHLSPVKVKHELDATGAKWLRANDPASWAKIAPAITIRPAKTSVEIR
jgi:hypothetical protein